MRVPEFDRIRATRRFGAFALLTLRAIEKIKDGQMTGVEAAAHFERVARTHRLRETGQVGGRRLTGTVASQGGPSMRFVGHAGH